MYKFFSVDNSFRRKIYNTGLLSINLFVSRFSGFIRNLLIARFLSPEIASLGFLSISFGHGVRTFFEIGTRQFLITSKSVDERLIGSAWLVEFTKGFLLTFLLVILALSGVLENFNIPNNVILISATIPVCAGILSPYTFLWERDQNFKKIVIQSSLSTLIGLFFTIVMLSLDFGWQSIPLGIALGLLTQAFWSHFSAKRIPPIILDISCIKRIIGRGSPYILIALTTYAYTMGVDVALAMSGAINWVGPYRMGFALAQVVIGSMPGVFVHASLSSEAKRFRSSDINNSISTDFYSFGIVMTVIAAVTPFCFFSLPGISTFLFGDAWKSTSMIVPWLSILVSLRCISAQISVIALAVGKPRIEAKIRSLEAFGSLIVVFSLAGQNIFFAIYGMILFSFISLILRTRTLKLLNVKEYAHILKLIYTLILSILFVIVVANYIPIPFAPSEFVNGLIKSSVSASLSTIIVLASFIFLNKKLNIFRII